MWYDPFTGGDTKMDNVSKQMKFLFGEIHCYLMDTAGQFTQETIMAYRLFDAYTYFQSAYRSFIRLKDVGTFS